MVKYLWILFAALLLLAHWSDVQGDAYHRPLSMFRDYQPAWIGYALFAVLIAIDVATIRTAIDVQAESDARVYAVTTALLSIVAVTRSGGVDVTVHRQERGSDPFSRVNEMFKLCGCASRRILLL